MALVLKLDPLVQPRSRRERGMEPFEGLNAGLFVVAHDVGALRFELRGLLVGLADRLHILGVLLGVFLFVRRRQPVAALMRSELGFFLVS